MIFISLFEEKIVYYESKLYMKQDYFILGRKDSGVRQAERICWRVLHPKDTRDKTNLWGSTLIYPGKSSRLN